MASQWQGDTNEVFPFLAKPSFPGCHAETKAKHLAERCVPGRAYRFFVALNITTCC
jgi:hypothetical protein